MKFSLKVDVVNDNWIRILYDNPDYKEPEVLLVMDSDEAVELGTKLINHAWPLLKTQRKT